MEPDVADDAGSDDAPPPVDDEDELMFPDLVDKFSKWAMEGQYMEEMAQAP
jgi:hypothetical protein